MKKLIIAFFVVSIFSCKSEKKEAIAKPNYVVFKNTDGIIVSDGNSGTCHTTFSYEYK